MADDSGGGGKNPGPNSTPRPPNTLPDQKAATTAWAMGGASGGNKNMRTFAEIIEQEKTNRNILEIHLTKTAIKPKNLTFDDLGDLIFDILKINPDDCLGFDYTTGRYDSRPIKLRPTVDT